MTADNDPSMDDILASIRKIISDDEVRAQVSGNAMPSAVPANAPIESRPAMGMRAGLTGNREDVLLLTDLIEEPKLGSPEPLAPTPIPRIDPIHAGEMPQPAFEETSPISQLPPLTAPPLSSAPIFPAQTMAPSPFEPSIVASSVAGAASSAFDRLNQAVEDSKAAPQAAPATAPAASPVLGNGGKTIEDLVKEMLRPMLKDWIDRSLPPMVERLVEREIARLTRR